jgi:hypothetical protein
MYVLLVLVACSLLVPFFSPRSSAKQGKWLQAIFHLGINVPLVGVSARIRSPLQNSSTNKKSPGEQAALRFWEQ